MIRDLYHFLVGEPDASSPLTPALIAAFSAILVGTIALLGQHRLASVAAQRQRADAAAERLRNLATLLAGCVQAQYWLLWKAEHAPKQLGEADLDGYDSRYNELCPKMLGAQIVVQARDETTQGKSTELVNRVFRLDHQIALASVRFHEEPGEGSDLLRKRLAECHELYCDIRKILPTLLGTAPAPEAHP